MGFENNAIKLASGTAKTWYGARNVNGQGGENSPIGPTHIVRKRVSLLDLVTDLTAAAGLDEALAFTDTSVPAGAIVRSARVRPIVGATSGGAADILVGLYYINGNTVTALDADGLVAAGDGALADLDTAGEAGIVGAGALVNTVLAATAGSYFIGAVYATAAYTAGEVDIEVEWIKPL